MDSRPEDASSVLKIQASEPVDTRVVRVSRRDDVTLVVLSPLWGFEGADCDEEKE